MASDPQDRVGEVRERVMNLARRGEADKYGAGKWRQLEEMAQAVKQGDADENAVVAWMWDTLGVRLATHPAPVAVTDEMRDAGIAAWLAWEQNGRTDDETAGAMVDAIVTAALRAAQGER